MNKVRQQVNILLLKDLCSSAIWKWYLGVQAVTLTYDYGNKQSRCYMVVHKDWIN